MTKRKQATKYATKIYNIEYSEYVCSNCKEWGAKTKKTCDKCGMDFDPKQNLAKDDQIAIKIWNNEDSLYVCSNCGKHVGVVHDSCPLCHSVFSDNPNLLVCPSCNYVQKNLKAEYCRKCGKSIFTYKSIEVKQCPDCKTEFDEEDEFCDKDGKKLSINTIEVPDDKNPNFKLTQGSAQSKTGKKTIPTKDNKEEPIQPTELPMNWYKFITYGLCPIAVIASLLWIAILYDRYSYNDYFNLAVGGMLVNSVLSVILAISLHQKTTWSWKFLIGLYAFNGLFGRIELLDEWGSMSYFIFVIFVNALTTLPNYIYFNKRRHLFVNKFEF